MALYKLGLKQKAHTPKLFDFSQISKIIIFGLESVCVCVSLFVFSNDFEFDVVRFFQMNFNLKEFVDCF